MEIKEIKKLKYEKPVVLNLGEVAKGAGENCAPGSSATDDCTAGNSAPANCGSNGPTAGACQTNGAAAGAWCGSGTTAFTCASGSSDTV